MRLQRRTEFWPWAAVPAALLVALAACQSTDSLAPPSVGRVAPARPAFSSTSATRDCDVDPPPWNPGETNTGTFTVWNTTCATLWAQYHDVWGTTYGASMDPGTFRSFQAYSDWPAEWCFGPSVDNRQAACFSGPPGDHQLHPMPVFVYSAPPPPPPPPRDLTILYGPQNTPVQLHQINKPRFRIRTTSAVMGVRG